MVPLRVVLLTHRQEVFLSILKEGDDAGAGAHDQRTIDWRLAFQACFPNSCRKYG